MRGLTVGGSFIAALLYLSLQWRIVCAQVVELTPETFESMATKGTWFVEHFAPWCPHCQQFAPTWTQLGEDHADLKTSKNFHIGKIDCTVYGDLCNDHGIKGYPTMQLFVNGKYIENYDGKRDLATVSAYIVKAAEQYAAEVANMPVPKQVPIAANPDGKVVQLTPASYQTKVAGGKQQWFIQMYTPWCSYCKDMSSIWTQLASSLKGQVNVASINCEASNEAKTFCMKQGITGYPTIQFVSGDHTSEYKGARTLDSLIQYTKKYNSELQEITGAQLTSIQQDDSVAFIHLYNENSKSSLDLIKAVSKYFIADVPFYVTADPISIRHLGYETAELPAAVILKGKHKFVFSSNDYANTAENRRSIQTWVQKEKFPIVNEISLSNAEEILKSDHLLAFALFDGSKNLDVQKKEFKTMTDAWLDKGNKNSNILFVWIDGTKWSDYVHKVFGIKKTDLPRIVIADPKNDRFYPKDSDGRLLTMEEPQTVLKSIVEAQNDLLEAVSTRASAKLPIQKDHDSYHSFVQDHKTLTLLILIVVAGVAYKVFMHKRPAGDLLPSSNAHSKHHE